MEGYYSSVQTKSWLIIRLSISIDIIILLFRDNWRANWSFYFNLLFLDCLTQIVYGSRSMDHRVIRGGRHNTFLAYFSWLIRIRNFHINMRVGRWENQMKRPSKFGSQCFKAQNYGRLKRSGGDFNEK